MKKITKKELDKEIKQEFTLQVIEYITKNHSELIKVEAEQVYFNLRMCQCFSYNEIISNKTKKKKNK